jgi:hypothetical protein
MRENEIGRNIVSLNIKYRYDKELKEMKVLAKTLVRE